MGDVPRIYEGSDGYTVFDVVDSKLIGENGRDCVER